jgi:hypothetical protein
MTILKTTGNMINIYCTVDGGVAPAAARALTRGSREAGQQQILAIMLSIILLKKHARGTRTFVEHAKTMKVKPGPP